MGECAMKDRFGRPIATLNVPLVRVEETATSLKMSVSFEASLDLRDVTTYTSDEDLSRYLRAFLMKHVSDWYWGAQDGC